MEEFTSVPVIDIQALINPLATNNDKQIVVSQIFQACRSVGFFYITNHGVSTSLQDKILELSREFFSLPLEEKKLISNGKSSWRGFFPVGSELTSGKPDGKEGIYLGKEFNGEINLFPERPSELKDFFWSILML